MEYTFQFGEVFADYPELLSGAALTLYLSLGAMAIGLVVGTLGALALDSGGRILRGAVRAYVEAIRNTPFLVQLFMVFFALPEIGIGLTGNQAALVAMSLNLGAYATEIIRAGAEGVGQGQIEAARALGLRPLQIFRRIILFQALRSVYPPLCSQFVLIMLASAVVSAVAAEELSGVANNIQARTFRSFEIYIVVTGMYLVMTLAVQAVLGLIGRLAFSGRGR
ncbi:MAG: amino acid ABC transporter permease [Acetobacteraceae bacterium]|nr:amino acid ABC transporter permease [Acetobacteraceae bacterium]